MWSLLTGLCLAAGPAERLHHEDPDQRAEAYRALAAEAPPGALETLARALATEPDPEVRAAGQQAMARLPVQEPELLSLLGGSEVALARAWSAHALGRTCSPAANEALLAAAGDPEELVRREVYAAMGRCADPRALRVLSRAAVNDPSAAARADAQAAALRSTRRVDHDVPTDIALLRAGELADRVAAAERLGESGDWRALDPLLEVARAGPLELRQAALLALGHLGDLRAVPPLLALLDATAGPLRYHVLAALAHLRDESTVPALGALLGDPDPTTRQLAVRALGWVGTRQALDAMAPAARDVDEAVRTELVLALSASAQPGRVEPLLALTRDPSPFVRAEAARALAASGDPRAGEALVRLLGDADALVRLAAAEGAAALGLTGAVEPLRALVKRAEDEGERAVYTRALAALGG